MKYTASVITGHGRGKTLGFPTFNLSVPKSFNLKHGIYACWVWLERSDAPRSNRLAKRPNRQSARSSVADVGLGKKKYPGALHYGPVPIFNQPHPSLEIFVLDYNSNTLIHRLTFQPVKYLRPIKNFSSPQILKSQITQDVVAVRTILSQ